MKYYYLTRFDFDRHIKHGGTHRVNQIVEKYSGDLLGIGKLKPVNRDDFRIKDYLSILNIFFKSRKFILSKPSRFRFFIKYFKSIYSLYYNLSFFYKEFVEKEEEFVLITDLIGKHYLVTIIAKMLKIKCIYILHNLESLVPDSKFAFSYDEKWLDHELNYLHFCDRVVTISREEYWFLLLNKISAEYLPYYPVANRLADLMKIRDNRIGTMKKGFLILGSYVNHPTKLGMDTLLDQLLHNTNLKNELFYVVGLGTEEIVDEDIIGADHIRIIGTVSNSLLTDYLSTVKGVIIYQPISSGALTKLIELDLCGIICYCNPESARSNYCLSNVYLYNNWRELEHLILGK